MTHIQEVQSMIKLVIEEIEDGRVVDPTVNKMAYAPTGDCFLSFTSGGLKREGETVGVWCASEGIALEMLLRRLISYKHKHPGVIYWRQKPTVHMMTFLGPDANASPFSISKETMMKVYPLYYGWARIVISDKPILEKGDLEKLMKGDIDAKNVHRDPS